MDVVVIPSDGCPLNCYQCPYSGKKITKNITPPNEIPDGLLVFCPGAINFPQTFLRLAQLAEMSGYAVLMAPISEEPPDFTYVSNFDLVIAVAPSLSYLDSHRHKAEARLETAACVRIGLPFDHSLIDEVVELESPAFITPPMVDRPTIEEVMNIEGLRLSDKGFSKMNIGARAIRRGFYGRRSIVFLMISSALYDSRFKLVTPTGSKVVTYSSLMEKEVEAIVHVDLKLPNGKIVPDKLLRILDLIDNKGNLTRVAEMLGTTYQNISQTVRRYEAMLGVKLIESSPGKGGGAKLTPEGKKLISLWRDVISNVEF